MTDDHYKHDKTPCMHENAGNPETVWELLNKYGTYNIQPTADTDQLFPTIAQGYPHTPPISKESKQ